MFIFDTHCDTITTARSRGLSLANDRLELSLDRPMGDSWCQCFAIWADDKLQGEAAWLHYARHRRFFAEQVATHPQVVAQARCHSDIVEITSQGRVAALLTVENGNMLAGDIGRIASLASDGVRMLTLTWNDANELAGGQQAGGGFTSFGREAVAELERCGIVVDVSHLGDESFWELVRLARRPIVASHSNSRTVHNHLRNLTDKQIAAVADSGGIVAATYHQPFIGDGEVQCDLLLRHLEQIITIGGAQAAALGSDFDGGVPPQWLGHSEQVQQLSERLVSEFGGKLAAAIAGGNALLFLERYEEGTA